MRTGRSPTHGLKIRKRAGMESRGEAEVSPFEGVWLVGRWRRDGWHRGLGGEGVGWGVDEG